MEMKVGQMEAVSQGHTAADPYYDELNRLERSNSSGKANGQRSSRRLFPL
jgi:hypothetical protein